MSSHYSWPALTPRFDLRAELRHRCAPRRSTYARRAQWLRIPDQNWLRFCDRYHFHFMLLDAMFEPHVKGAERAVIVHPIDGLP